MHNFSLIASVSCRTCSTHYPALQLREYLSTEALPTLERTAPLATALRSHTAHPLVHNDTIATREIHPPVATRTIRMSDLPPLSIGQTLGVEWLGVLGQGGFGKVYKARDIETGNVSHSHAEASFPYR
jgi:hypothetical protein